jgi:predicted nucleotidyltransferase
MPTPYADLNAVIAELVSGAREILGENFCGAYLQGSFAVGDADEHSDVDFLVVVHDELTDAQQAALKALHERLYAIDTPWAQHLEGSYVPKTQLRRMSPERPPWFYFDNGATEPIWDNHDNSAVVAGHYGSTAWFLPAPTRRPWSTRSVRRRYEPTRWWPWRSGRSGFPRSTPGVLAFSRSSSSRIAGF